MHIFPPSWSASEISKNGTAGRRFLVITVFPIAKKHKPCSANQTLSEGMRKYWTVADIALEHWTFADVTLNIAIDIMKTALWHQTVSRLLVASTARPAVAQRLGGLESPVRKCPVFRFDRDYHRWIGNGTRLASLFACPADA
jgi:hypothetical protein